MILGPFSAASRPGLVGWQAGKQKFAAKGSGTINGSGNYRFMLTAIDGQVNGGGSIDKFRNKIWNAVSCGTFMSINSAPRTRLIPRPLSKAGALSSIRSNP